MAEKPKLLIVTLAQFSEGWIVFGGFDDHDRVVTHHFPMRRVGTTPDGDVIVADETRNGRAR